MGEEIYIQNIIKSGNNKYNVSFNSNFQMTNLKYSISVDGINWQNQITLNSFSSPQEITVLNLSSFYLKMTSDFEPMPTRIHSSVYSSVYN